MECSSSGFYCSARYNVLKWAAVSSIDCVDTEQTVRNIAFEMCSAPTELRSPTSHKINMCVVCFL